MDQVWLIAVGAAIGLLPSLLVAYFAHVFAARRQELQLVSNVTTALELQDRAELRSAVVALLTRGAETVRAAMTLRGYYVESSNRLETWERQTDSADAASALRHELSNHCTIVELFVGREHVLHAASFAVVGEAQRMITAAEQGQDMGSTSASMMATLEQLRVAARAHLKIQPPPL